MSSYNQYGGKGLAEQAPDEKNIPNLDLYSPGISTIQEQADPFSSSDQGSYQERPHRHRHRHGLRVLHTADGKYRIWQWGFLKLRPPHDDDEQDWWFASTAIPLLAATMAPLANVLSIAALVTSWRSDLDPVNPTDATSVPFPDPHWCLVMNGASLACGFVGNFFLLLNFARRIRYLVALPMSILMWYIATGLLIADTASINIFDPPIRPHQTYSQGFWYAIISAVLYLMCSMSLMVNMLGYFLGHYPQHFILTDQQRTLILQTMMFFFWLAMGGAIFSKLNDWSFADALYFSDVTILTVGFGDFFATNDTARGIVFPYSVGGIIILGLMANSIRKFAKELSRDKVILAHVEKQRARTVERSVSSSTDLPDYQRPTLEELALASPASFAPINLKERALTFDEKKPSREDDPAFTNKLKRINTFSRLAGQTSKVGKSLKRVISKDAKMMLLRVEKDRFDAMRKIQSDTAAFKRWYNLCISIFAFGLLWCVGAVVFWIAEQHEQGLSYFEALYFCYVSLLTIGYGDLSPKSNAGKPFFVVWSLVAVPTMTILVTDMGDTVVRGIKDGTSRAADWTVLPKAGIWRNFLERNQWLMLRIQEKADKKAADKRIAEGFQVDPENPAIGANVDEPETLEELADSEPNEHELARRLATAIRKTASHLTEENPRRYNYTEWVQITRLIRFTKDSGMDEVDIDVEEKGLIEWDWIGEDSPMMADRTEPEWVLDRLCESLARYMRKMVPAREKRRMSETAQANREAAAAADLALSRSLRRGSSNGGMMPPPVSGRAAFGELFGRRSSSVAVFDEQDEDDEEEGGLQMRMQMRRRSRTMSSGAEGKR